MLYKAKKKSLQIIMLNIAPSFFRDNPAATKECIRMDVQRTFPHLGLFQEVPSNLLLQPLEKKNIYFEISSVSSKIAYDRPIDSFVGILVIVQQSDHFFFCLSEFQRQSPVASFVAAASIFIYSFLIFLYLGLAFDIKNPNAGTNTYLKSSIFFHSVYALKILIYSFQNKPLHHSLCNILETYASYHPTVGYVQGMSSVAAMLFLNMQEEDAYVTFSNLINTFPHNEFFRIDEKTVRSSYSIIDIILASNLVICLSIASY